MVSDRPRPENGEPATDQREALRVLPGAASGEDAGGDPACWACLVCQECGAVVTEGHLVSCSQSSCPADLPRSGA